MILFDTVIDTFRIHNKDMKNLYLFHISSYNKGTEHEINYFLVSLSDCECAVYVEMVRKQLADAIEKWCIHVVK
jgi:hypothetical protein